MPRSDRLLDDALREAIRATIADDLGRPVEVAESHPLGGGSISQALVVVAGDRRWFVKRNEARLVAIFAAEADGLAALASCPALRVPRVVGYGIGGSQAYLVLEYLPMSPLSASTASVAGSALASLHRIQGPSFGWHRDNFIGSTRQANSTQDSWPIFFAEQRLRPQLALARANARRGTLSDRGARLLEKLPALFAGHLPEASLLHGDLWYGNVASDAAGSLLLFDPAVYYGDRETDLAMSELFGGFPAGFYAAYREDWPIADGYALRRTLYNLYHVLNHLNLFGDSYAQQAERMIGTLLAELGG